MKNYLLATLKWFGIFWVISFALSYIQFDNNEFYRFMGFARHFLFLVFGILALAEIHKKEGKVKFGTGLLALLIGSLAISVFGLLVGFIRGGNVEIETSIVYWITNIVLIKFVISLVLMVQLGRFYVYTKAGYSGWVMLIPIYNMVVLMKIGGKPGAYFLLFLIPIANIYFQIMWLLEIAKKFGKDTSFAIGLILLGGIFWCILGYDDSEYLPLKTETAMDSFGIPEQDVNMEDDENNS